MVFKFSHVRQPFLVRRVRVKLTAQIVLCNMFRLRYAFRTSSRTEFYRRLDVQRAVNAKHPLVVHTNTTNSVQVVSNPTVALVGMRMVNLFHLLCNLLVLQFTLAFRLLYPSIVGGTSNVQRVAKRLHRVIPFPGKCPNSLVFAAVADKAQRHLSALFQA